MPPPSRRQLVDPLGLVAGMFDALGLGAVIDHATRQTPETRLVTVGHAVKAMVLTGMGCVNQHRDRVPLLCQHKPTPRLLAPGIDAHHLHDAGLGRALDTLYAYGVTALSTLMASTSAPRVGRTPRFAPLHRTRVHVDGRDNRAEEPDAHRRPRPRGDRRAPRPALTHVRLALMVEPQAGLP
jgi:Domain of unknown function (DUF4277)